MKTLYVGSSINEKRRDALNVDLHVNTHTWLADSKEEAIGRATVALMEKYPTSEGWVLSHLHLNPVTPETVSMWASEVKGGPA